MVARILPVPIPARHPFEHLVFLGAAQEIDRAFLAAAFPEGKGDGGLVINHQDPATLGHLLSQPLGFDPLEGTPVVLLESLPGGQQAQRVGAPIQAVEVAPRQLDAFMPGSMRGGFVPVTVGGEDFVSGQFGNVGQPVMELSVSLGQNPGIDLPQHRAPARALSLPSHTRCTPSSTYGSSLASRQDRV